MKLVLIPSGTFTMCSPIEEVGSKDFATPHEVTISKSFYIGVFEVTLDEYKKVMGSNPSERNQKSEEPSRNGELGRRGFIL